MIKTHLVTYNILYYDKAFKKFQHLAFIHYCKAERPCSYC